MFSFVLFSSKLSLSPPQIALTPLSSRLLAWVHGLSGRAWQGIKQEGCESPTFHFFSFCLKKFFFNVYLFLRQRHSMSMGGAEREGDPESEAGSRLQAVSTEPDAGLKPMKCEIMT